MGRQSSAVLETSGMHVRDSRALNVSSRDTVDKTEGVCGSRAIYLGSGGNICEVEGTGKGNQRFADDNIRNICPMRGHVLPDTDTERTIYRLIMVGKASRSAFAYPLARKEIEDAAGKLLELVLTFVVPLFLCSKPRTDSSQR